MDRDFKRVDDFLVKWDRFARGENELVPQIRESTADFEQTLAKLLQSDDPRAPSRLVFYAVVQVGGFINAESELGKAALQVLGDAFTTTTMKDGTEVLFAGDLYFWWQDHKTEYEAFPLFDEWQARDFAQSTAIPLYKGIRQNK